MSDETYRELEIVLLIFTVLTISDTIYCFKTVHLKWRQNKNQIRLIPLGTLRTRLIFSNRILPLDAVKRTYRPRNLKYLSEEPPPPPIHTPPASMRALDFPLLCIRHSGIHDRTTLYGSVTALFVPFIFIFHL